MSRTEVQAPTKPSGIPWLGEVPAHWEVKRLKHVAKLRSGEAITIDAIEEEGAYPVFGGNGLRGYTDRYTNEGTYVLIGRQGALCGNVNYAQGKFWASEHAVVCHPVTDAEPIWLGELLRSMNLGQYSQSAAQPGLAVERIESLLIPVPPLPEQRAIAAFLDERMARIDALVARKRRLVQLLKEKRQALITRAVTRGLDPKVKMKESGVPWLGEVPEGWEVVPLRHIAESIQTGPFGSQLHEADYIEGGIPLINPAHMIQGEIMPEAESAVDEATKERLARYVLDAGDILFARRGEIGRCALVADHQAGWMCGTGSMRLRLADSDPGYYAILFGSRGFAEALELNAVGTTMLNINPTILARQFVPRPPRTEQTEIREYVASTTARIDALVTKVEAAVERLQEYRTALISAAVTGKVRIPIR